MLFVFARCSLVFERLRRTWRAQVKIGANQTHSRGPHQIDVVLGVVGFNCARPSLLYLCVCLGAVFCICVYVLCLRMLYVLSRRLECCAFVL